MAKVGKKKPKKEGEQALRQRVGVVDDLREFENFREEVLPALRADLLEKKLSAMEIYDKYASYAAARGVSIALNCNRRDTALAAIRDILDRSGGKPVQKTENHHVFDDMNDEDLDALVASKMEVKNRAKKRSK